jgi:predicted DCC family thiol-disulfide oxidoreductase YuxK
MAPHHTVVFFDGVCGLCDRLVQFLLQRDRSAALRFAPLQSDLAQRALAEHGLDASNLDTVVVVRGWQSSSERVSVKSRAVVDAVDALGGIWRVAALAMRMTPRPIGDAVYDFVARVRYRIFGRFDTCRVPPADWKERFLA